MKRQQVSLESASNQEGFGSLSSPLKELPTLKGFMSGLE